MNLNAIQAKLPGNATGRRQEWFGRGYANTGGPLLEAVAAADPGRDVDRPVSAPYIGYTGARNKDNC